MPKDFISLVDWPAADLLGLVKASQTFRRWWIDGNSPPVLKGRRIALIWGAAGFRNRVAFELGIAELGGIAVEIRTTSRRDRAPGRRCPVPGQLVRRYRRKNRSSCSHAQAGSFCQDPSNKCKNSVQPSLRDPGGSRLHSGSARHFEGAARRIRRCGDESWTLLVRSGSDASN